MYSISPPVTRAEGPRCGSSSVGWRALTWTRFCSSARRDRKSSVERQWASRPHVVTICEGHTGSTVRGGIFGTTLIFCCDFHAYRPFNLDTAFSKGQTCPLCAQVGPPTLRTDSRVKVRVSGGCSVTSSASPSALSLIFFTCNTIKRL